MRFKSAWVFLAGACVLATGCNTATGPHPLASVSALPKPALPAWISSISPAGGNAQSLAQVRVIFAKPVTKVEALEGDGPADVLSHFSMTPSLAGKFVVLTPRMVGFVASQALPVGTRVRVTMSSGLRDLDGDALGQDVSWTFQTAALAFSDLPDLKPQEGSTPLPSGLNPTITISANAQVDAASLSSHATLSGGGDTVPLDATLQNKPTPYPGSGAQEQFDPSLNDWAYDLKPQRALRTATTYELRIAPGVAPANGNVETATAFAGGIRTYDALAVAPTEAPSPGAGSGRFADGDPVVNFNNPIDPKSIAGQVAISPAPGAPGTIFSVPDGSSTIAIDAYQLDPDASYTVTVGSGVKDTFGQSLGHDQRIAVKTSDFAAGIWAPTGTNVIPAGAPVDLDMYATNLPGNRYRSASARVPVTSLLANGGNFDPSTALPDSSRWAEHALSAPRNKQNVVRVPLQSLLGGSFGALAYGFWTPIDPQNPTVLTGLVQLTNLGIFAQWFPQSGMIRLAHLSDGGPAGGADVTVYRISSDPGVKPAQCAGGVTDAGGTLNLRGVDLERCYAGSSTADAPSLGVIATSGSDNASLVTYDYSGIYSFDVFGGWATGAPLSRGTLFPDRDMYQPGEAGHVTGIAYYVQNGKILADRNAAYRITLKDPSGNSTPLQTVNSDRYGVLSLPISFGPHQALGYYTIEGKGANGNTIDGSFRVAEFKPPNFSLTLALDKTTAASGASVTANAKAQYLFGAPLQGGTAQATVTREAANLQPKGWDAYWFGPQWFWPDQQPSFTTDVSQNALALDQNGAASLNVAVPADLPFPMTYTVDVQATDVSHLSVDASQSFLALPGDATIGLSTDGVVSAGSPLSIQTIVTDGDGKPISGRGIHVELQKMTYTSATQSLEGGDQADQAVKYSTVDSVDATSSGSPVTVSLKPPEAGPYRIRANFSGAQSDAGATDVQAFAFGPGEIDWGGGQTTNVDVHLDKKTYKVGESARVLIASPFERSDVYVAVVRNDVLYQTMLHDVSGAPTVRIPITPDMLPNAAVEAVVVRRGPNLSTVKPGSLDSLSRVGMTAFDVDVTDRYLKVGIAPARATVEPGGSERVAFALTGADGKPARGEIVAMAVDDAILQLSGYRLPDLVKVVYADQPISTRFGDNRQNVVLQTQKAPAEKGYGYGGGYLEGPASTRVREIFKQLAYYGTAIADSQGHASVTIPVPDNLTTWRVMAVAIGTDDAHFGTNDATFIATKPLILNPLLPQFARPGDVFDLGASVLSRNQTSASLSLAAQLSGALAFAGGDPASMRADEAPPNGTLTAYRFPVNVGTPAPTTVSFSGTSGAISDAFKVPFEVRDRATTESVIETGVTTSRAEIPIDLRGGGVLSVTVANSVVPQFSVGADQWMTDDPFPLSDDFASRLIVSTTIAKIGPRYHLTPAFDAPAQRASSAQRLVAMQRGDGGFAAFAGAQDSDPFASAYALTALAFARANGASVNSPAIAKASAYASQMLANPERAKWCGDPVCKAQMRFEMLWALAAAGDRRSDFLYEIVAQSDEFDSATQIRLARYLLALPSWHERGVAMADHLQQTDYITGRYAVANVTTPWGWLGSESDAQAQMLQLMIERKSPADQIDGAVRALVAQSCKCGWPTLDDTASAMIALDAFAATEHLTPSNVAVSAGGTSIGNASFGSDAGSRTFTQAAAKLGAGPLSIVASGGAAHYVVLYTYPTPPGGGGQLAGLRASRTISEAGAGTVLAGMDLAPVTAPLTVDAGRVFEIAVRVIADHPVDRLIIEDPLPAGFEAVDTSFKTSSAAVLPQSDSWQIDSQTIYKDRVMAFASHLGPGIYEVHYLVRSVTPGTYRWPGTQAYLQNAPEQFGRSAPATLTVR